MKILITGLVKNPQLNRLKEEGEKKGHQVDGCYASELIISAENMSFTPTLRNTNITNYELIYIWATGKRRWEWYTAAYYLNRVYGTKIVNRKVIETSNYYLTPAIDYLKQKDEGIIFPKSAVVFDELSVERVIEEFSFPLILKTAVGRQGRGVFLLNNVTEIKAKINELKHVSPSFVIREFIPNDGDIRVFTVGYKAIGAMRRIPPQGDFRSNISQGGSGEKYDLNSNMKVREIAEKLSKVTKTEIAGVDIMIHKDTGEPYVLEINPGPQFMGLEKFTSVNAAGEIIKYFESLINNKD